MTSAVHSLVSVDEQEQPESWNLKGHEGFPRGRMPDHM